MDPSRLKPYFIAQHPCVRIVTNEEDEVVNSLYDVARELRLNISSWSVIQGIRDANLHNTQALEGTENPAAALLHWRRTITSPTMCVCLDLAPHLEDPRVCRAFRELVELFRAGGVNRELAGGAHLVLVDHADSGSPLLATHSVRHYITPPDDRELEEIVKRALRNQHSRSAVEIDLRKRDYEAILQNLRGLSRRQAAQLITECVASDRKLTADDLATIIEGKRKLLSSAGTLEFVDSPATLDTIGGLNRLKLWLEHRQHSFDPAAADFGITPPRGVLLLGVQGAGKSLAAKAIATAWRRPLMKLDPSTLFDRFVGESERRLREALAQAQAMSPVVLWIDEIEKGFASASSTSTDGGLSRRMFGTLLNWMQEHSSPVFLVATANDIEALPPELLRKGRFDEIFFVDLPTRDARKAILSIHLKKRRQKPELFDLDALADATHGYSGAEIETGIASALHAVFAKRRAQPKNAPEPEALTTDLLRETLVASPPLSKVMHHKVAALRAWASGKCVPADDPE